MNPDPPPPSRGRRLSVAVEENYAPFEVSPRPASPISRVKARPSIRASKEYFPSLFQAQQAASKLSRWFKNNQKQEPKPTAMDDLEPWSESCGFWAAEETLNFPPRAGAAHFGISSDVLLELKTEQLERKYSVRKCLRYSLKDPKAVSNAIGLPVSCLTGWAETSAYSTITCRWGIRGAIHIPLNATNFVFAYPLLDSSDDWISAESKSLCFLLYGGFIYFDSEGEIIQINAIKNGTALCFDGPFRMDADESRQRLLYTLEKDARWKDITIQTLKTLPQRFAWILPGELPEVPYGGFCYQYSKQENHRMIRLNQPSLKVPILSKLAEDLGIQVVFEYQRMTIVSISGNSPLIPLGVKKGYVILKWNTELVTDVEALQRVYLPYRKGQAAVVTFIGYEGEQDRINNSNGRFITDFMRSGYFRIPSPRKTYLCAWQSLKVQQALLKDVRPKANKEGQGNIYLKFMKMDMKVELHGSEYWLSITYQTNRGSRNTSLWGMASGWSHVNVGLENHSWIPHEADAFAYLYPPYPEHDVYENVQDPRLLAFLRNGGYVYFDLKNEDLDTDQAAEGAMQNPPGDIPLGIAVDCGDDTMSSRTISLSTMQWKQLAKQQDMNELHLTPCTRDNTRLSPQLSPKRSPQPSMQSSASSRKLSTATETDNSLHRCSSLVSSAMKRNSSMFLSDLEGYHENSGFQALFAVEPVVYAEDDEPDSSLPLLKFCDSPAHEDRDRCPPTAENVCQTLLQEEFAGVPINSDWMKVTGCQEMCWIPMYGFGDTKQYLFGGLLFLNAHKEYKYYAFHGNLDTFTPCAGMSREEAEAQAKFCKDLVQESGNFDPLYRVRTPTRQWSLTNEVPYQLRPARGLLAKMGRKPDRMEEVVTGKGHYEFNAAEKQPIGIPNVVLRNEDCPFEDKIEIDAEGLEELLICKYGNKYNVPRPGWRFQPRLPPSEYKSWAWNEQPHVDLREWYTSSGKDPKPPPPELQTMFEKMPHPMFVALRNFVFEASLDYTQVQLPMEELDIPSVKTEYLKETFADYYTEIQFILKYSAEQIVLCNPVTHMRDLYGDKKWVLTKKEYDEIQSSTRIYTGDLIPPQFFKRLSLILSEEKHAQFWKEHAHLTLGPLRESSLNSVSDEHRAAVQAAQILVHEVYDDWEEFGFISKEKADIAMSTPICSLATSVCVSQMGYFMLDDDNRIQEKPDTGVLFIAACAPDFLNPNDRMQARQEVQKYFVPPDRKGKWRTHGSYHGRRALLFRIMEIWHRIFTACKDQQVTHPSILPLGLGIFRPRVADEKDALQVYFEAQFILLEQYDYGFKVVFVNPGPPNNREAMDRVLSRKQWHFKCCINITRCDATSVSNKLAKMRIRSCILIPADYLAVLQGLVGSWWEGGYNERYTGESHVVARSTAICARKNICKAWSPDTGIEFITKICLQNALSDQVPVCTYSLNTGIDKQAVQMTLANIIFIDMPRWWAQGDPNSSWLMPECLEEVTRSLRHSPYGYIKVHILPTQQMDEAIKDLRSRNKSQTSLLCYVREWVYSKLVETVSKDSSSEAADTNIDLDDINAVVVRFDATTLAQGLPLSLAYIISSLVDLRCKGLYPGVIMSATTGRVNSNYARALLNLGADTLFAFPTPMRSDYPVGNTYMSLLREICIQQRYSSSLTQAVYDNRISTVRKLLACGADPNHIHSSNGPWGNLHWAVHSQCLRTCRAVITEFAQKEADPWLPTNYTRNTVTAGSSIREINPGIAKILKEEIQKPFKAVQRDPSLWGLWITLHMPGHEVHPRSPVRRLRRGTDPFITSWQLYLNDPTEPITEELLARYLPNDKRIAYLRYIVIEVVSDRKAESIKWMDTIVSSLVTRLYELKHPCNPSTESGRQAWTSWARESVIVYVHHISILKEPLGLGMPTQYLTTPEGLVCVCKAFPLGYANVDPAKRPPLECINICTDSQELSELMELATVHWLVVNEEDVGMPVQQYDMAANLRLEKQYKSGLPVVSGVRQIEGWKIDVNLNLMLEIKYECSSQGRYRHADGKRYNIVQSRKVIRVPDHVSIMDGLAEAPTLLDEIRADNCLLFLGAGFSFPARLPGWTQLLINIAEVATACVTDIGSTPKVIPLSSDYDLCCMVADSPKTGLPPKSSSMAILKPATDSPNIRSISDATVPAPAEPSSPKRRATSFQEQVLVKIRHKNGEKAGEEEASHHLIPQKIISTSAQVKKLVSEPILENLEMAAQLLEDSCGMLIKWFLKGMLECVDGPDGTKQLLNGHYILNNSEKYQEMSARLMLVKHLPVAGILTTNYDQLLCYCTPAKRETNPCCVAKGITPQTKDQKPNYMAMVRKQDNKERESKSCSKGKTMSNTEAAEHEEDRLVIQIHGSTTDPQSIVLTREGYRGLLHLNPAYSNFLKTVMAGSILLYMGFSFTDGYFNEIRSELMTLRGENDSEDYKNPSSYAIINDKPKPVRDFFRDHEGVHLFSWQSEKHGFGVLDRYLDALLRCTHLAAALSQSKVLLFNPQTTPQIMLHGQKVEILDSQYLLDEYLPFKWDKNDSSKGQVIRTGMYAAVDDWVLVRFTHRAEQDDGGVKGLVFYKVLGDSLTSRPFYVSRRVLESKDGSIQEDGQVYVSRSACNILRETKMNTDPGLWALAGSKPDHWHYLIPFSLTVLDVKCHAVEITNRTGEKKVRVVPQKLLNPSPIERDISDTRRTLCMDITGMTRKIVEQLRKTGDLTECGPELEDALIKVQEAYETNIAMNSKPMDHTMETITEQLKKVQSSSLYSDASTCTPVAEIYQPFTLTSVTSLPLLMTHMGKDVQVHSVRTFVIINAADTTIPLHNHVELFKNLYHGDSTYLKWAYPPMTIIHTAGDVTVEENYRAVFIEHCLVFNHVGFAHTVPGVMHQLMKPAVSTSNKHPILETCSKFEDPGIPIFSQTIDENGLSILPTIPLHPLQRPGLSNVKEV